jgi:hypothetical protein
MSSCLLYTGLNYMPYSLHGEMKLSVIDSDLLYKCVFWGRLGCSYEMNLPWNIKHLYSLHTWLLYRGTHVKTLMTEKTSSFVVFYSCLCVWIVLYFIRIVPLLEILRWPNGRDHMVVGMTSFPNITQVEISNTEDMWICLRYYCIWYILTMV